VKQSCIAPLSIAHYVAIAPIQEMRIGNQDMDAEFSFWLLHFWLLHSEQGRMWNVLHEGSYGIRKSLEEKERAQDSRQSVPG